MSEITHNHQVEEIKEVINKVTTRAPDFLADKITADEMAHTMVNAIEAYTVRADHGNGIVPENIEARRLLYILQEIMGCGSGYLANRCDGACVARTVRSLVDEFHN